MKITSVKLLLIGGEQFVEFTQEGGDTLVYRLTELILLICRQLQAVSLPSLLTAEQTKAATERTALVAGLENHASQSERQPLQVR